MGPQRDSRLLVSTPPPFEVESIYQNTLSELNLLLSEMDIINGNPLDLIPRVSINEQVLGDFLRVRIALASEPRGDAIVRMAYTLGMPVWMVLSYMALPPPPSTTYGG